MAGGGTVNQQRGGRKAVDFTLNLVPTIDLLSVLIAFLLITAVWSQVSRIKVSQPLPRTNGDGVAEPPARALVVRLAPGAAQVAFTDDPPESGANFDAADGALGPKLQSGLAPFAARVVGTRREQVVRVLAADRVDYSTVITVLDALADHGLTTVKVGPDDGGGGP
jgi:biopolymer transport protein TolR